MKRTEWLQERRMEKFVDILDRCGSKQLSYLEVAEVLGMSERTFRRYRKRYEEEGEAGLVDGRLGKPSARAVPVDEITWVYCVNSGAKLVQFRGVKLVQFFC